MKHVHTIVIGGGPAGLAAAISAHKEGVSVLLIERESKLGGILKQCIHDGFGLERFKERLTGPEYAKRFIDDLNAQSIDILLSTTVLHIGKEAENYCLDVINANGVDHYSCKSLVLSTGCRERTSRQVFIHGQRPSGVYTAGSAQYFMNILGMLPTRRCVILGSGDIGLIMARRLSLEGAQVLGVYEAKPTPSGLTRNLLQCLEDYNIPLHLSHTVTKVYGDSRLEAVEISKVDENMQQIPGTSYRIECDALILSVGLIPENELAQSLSIPLDPKTKGPFVDQYFMTEKEGCFVCGNALHVNDLVDHVSYCATKAGVYAAQYEDQRHYDQPIHVEGNFGYFIPQRIRYPLKEDKVSCYFRVNREMKQAKFSLLVDDQTVYTKILRHVKPPEMEFLELEQDLFKGAKKISVKMEEHL